MVYFNGRYIGFKWYAVLRNKMLRYGGHMFFLYGFLRMAMIPEAADTAALCFVGIYGEGIITPAPGVRHMVCATANAAAVPAIHNVKYQRRIYTNGGVQGRRRLPGAVTDAAYILAFGIGFI